MSGDHPCTYALERPFAGSECQRVLDPHVRDDFIAVVSDMFAVERSDSRRNKFPGAVPCSMMRADLELLRTRHYVALEKTDGTRYLLLVTMMNRIPFCVLIDRNRTVRVVNLRFDTATHVRSTLFDTELVQHADSGAWVLLVFDLIASGHRLRPPLSREQRERQRGIQHSSTSYTTRMTIASDIVRREWHPQRETDAFSISVKRYTQLDDFDRLRDAAQMHNGFPTDGYVFVPVPYDVSAFRNRHMLKWKPIEQHTIDLRLHCRNNTFEFWMKDERDEPRLFMPVNRAVPRNERFLTAHGVSVQLGALMIVECSFDPHANDWSIVRQRADKQEPNAQYTIERTLQNVRENITKDELFHVILHERRRHERGGAKQSRREVPASERRFFQEAPPQPQPPPVQRWHTASHPAAQPAVHSPFPPTSSVQDPYLVPHRYTPTLPIAELMHKPIAPGTPLNPMPAQLPTAELMHKPAAPLNPVAPQLPRSSASTSTYDPERPQYDAVPLNASLQRLVDKYILPASTTVPTTATATPPAQQPLVAPKSPLHDMLENLRATLAREAT